MTQTVTQTVFSLSGIPTITPTNVGDILVLFLRTSGATAYLTALTDSQGNTWAPVIGSFGNSNSRYADTAGFFNSAYWAVAGATSTDTLTATYNSGTPATIQAAIMDCAGCSTTSPIITNIYNSQSAPGTGTDAITTAGGTGSDTVSSAPALLIANGWLEGGTFSAGTGWTLSVGGFNTKHGSEYKTVSSAGTYDATASQSAANKATLWMIALAAPSTSGGGGTPFLPYSRTQFFVEDRVIQF